MIFQLIGYVSTGYHSDRIQRRGRYVIIYNYNNNRYESTMMNIVCRQVVVEVLWSETTQQFCVVEACTTLRSLLLN
jgi:hypothetical protein